MVRLLIHLLFVALSFAPVQAETYSYSDILNGCEADQRKALEEARDSLGFREDTPFQPLGGGLSLAQLYSFSVEGNKYVLRFLGLIASQSEVMRHNEIRALKIGHKLGLAPDCVFSDQHAVVMVMPFIEGHVLRQPDDSQLVQLGKMIRTLHDYSDPYPTRFSLRDKVSQHYRKCMKSGIALPTGLDQEIQTMLSTPCSRATVPCHGDLNPSNILVDDSSKSITIVDWTTATWDDPFFDLGYFCLLANLSPAQERIFLEAYFERTPSEKEYEILRQEKANVCLLTAMVWLRYSEDEEERALPLASRVSALDAELHSSTLKSAQDYLREGVVIDFFTAPKSAIKSYALSFYKAYLDANDS